MKHAWPLTALIFGLFLVPARAQEKPKPWWDSEVSAGLERAGGNRAELEKALLEVPAEQRKGMAFLVANMPDQDAKMLKAQFLLDNTALAYQARDKTPWGKKIPEELFLNDVLPYVSVTEKREEWRKEMMELCLPLVKDCKTPGEAAALLNSQIFNKVNVKYSTLRNRADQSPGESKKTGLASCTGLSIILIDACRSVGIPARIAGIPNWVDKRGNHTWVEVWDEKWHFTGACEADPKGLDRGWFVGDAAQAKKDVPEHAIYASSFKRTNTTFPMVWAANNKTVFAENVTDRYTALKKVTPNTRVLIRVWNESKTKRVAVPVAIDALHGISKDERVDTNDILAFELPQNKEFTVRLGDPARVEQKISTGDKEQLIVDILWKADAAELTPEQVKSIENAAEKFFTAPEKDRAEFKFDPALDALLAADEAAVRQAVWKAYKASSIHAELKADFEKKQVHNGKHLSAYTIKEVGKKPKNGWPLFIALHGGGNAPKELNDSQWAMMQKYYRDQPSAEGYVYVALRAPNDTWNGFYDDYVCALIENLIKQFVFYRDVDVNKVFIMGYSHGGYGAFYLGPKMPDRFAAIHASASAPTDGTISAKSLRNTRFTFMVGENDTAYGRRERCEKFNAEIEKLRKDNPGEYPVEFEFKTGFGHGGLPDRDKIKDMIGFTRNPSPKHVTWEPMDNFRTDLYWLSISKPAKGQFVDAKIDKQKITLDTKNVEEITLWLDSRMIDEKKALAIEWNGKKSEAPLKPELKSLCESLLRRGDIDLAGDCKVIVK